MNLPEVARQHKPSPYTLNPLQLPASIHVHNASAGMFNGDLFVSLVTDDGHVVTYEFEGEPLEALRAALAPAEEDDAAQSYASMIGDDLPRTELLAQQRRMTGRV